MVSVFSRPLRLVFASMALVSTFGMTGCGVDGTSATQSVALPGKVIQGNVHGGVYPIQGATIRLMETQSTGYGQPAKTLLQTTSDSNGYFTFPDTGWTCDSTQFAYITVTTGHTDVNAVNNNVAQIGVIGNCGQVLANTSEVDAVQVFVSELSTIAAAYTLRSFITIDNTNASSGQQIINISAPAKNNAAAGKCTTTTPTTCVAAGLAHGFQDAYNLVDSVSYNGKLPTGQARLSPPSNAYAYVPQALINTLGNVLQSCVDSPGGTVANPATYTPGGTGSSRCGDLFYWATPPGGTAPTNTLQVALNMAQYPANHASNLYALQPRAVFFTPTLNQAPKDLSLSMFYLTETFAPYAGALVNPVGVTLDANDNAYILATSGSGSSNTQTAVLGLSAGGGVMFAGPTNGTYLYPQSIAADTLGNVWFTNNDPTTSANSGIIGANTINGTMTFGAALPSASGIAVDNSNNVWATIATTATPASSYGSFNEFAAGSLKTSGVLPSRASSSLGLSLGSLAIDANQDVWSVSSSGGSSQAVAWQNRGTVQAPTYNSTKTTSLSSKTGAFGAAVDASNTGYFPLSTELDSAYFNNGHNVLSNSQGSYAQASTSGATYKVPNQTEVDGAGNIFWTDLESTGQVFQLVPGANGNVSAGTLYSIFPCYPDNGACYAPAVSNLRGMQIDSSGALWYVADATYQGYSIGVIIQTFGIGAPTWPQMSLGQPGTMPQ